MKKFEYYMIFGDNDEVYKALNRYGAEGWEAFAVVPGARGVVVYLKREVSVCAVR